MARLVLVHGAFAGAWCWQPMLPGLEQAGHSVEVLDLPGSGSDTTPVADITLEAYARRVGEVLASGPAAVLVGHSMGGLVITQAAAMMPERVSMLVYLTAFVPVEGESLLELTQRPEARDDQIQANLTVTGEPPVAKLSADAARLAIYGMCTQEQFEWAVPQRRPQPVAPFASPLVVASSHAGAFATLARAYITCTQDRAIPPAMQRYMFTRAGCDPVIELDSDHAPYLSHTSETVTALDQLARRIRSH